LDSTFRLLNSVDTSGLGPLYPRNRVAPDGRLFGYSDLSMYYVDPNANSRNGSITLAGVMPSDGPSGVTSTDVMYAPGKVLRCGGGANTLPETGGPVIQAKNAAAVIDINGATPIYKKLPSMPASLHWANATVLADGNVVVTGGSLLANVMNGVNYSALLWKAGTGGWAQGATSLANRARLYHSVALLLPDGSVLSGGGGARSAIEYGRRDLLPTIPIQQLGRVRAQADDHIQPWQHFLPPELPGASRLGCRDPAGDVHQDELSDPQQ